MTAQIIPFPKVHRDGRSPKLVDLTRVKPKREKVTDKIRQTIATIWKPGGVM